MKSSNTRSWIKAAVVNLVLILGLLGAAEFVVRFFELAPDVISIDPNQKEGIFVHSPNPRLGYLFVPNFATPVPAYDHSFFRTNSRGLRDRERLVRKKPGWRRTILLGDSVVSAIHTNVDYILGRQIEKIHGARGRKIETISMGVIGYCTRGEVELLETMGLRYEPDLVLLLFVENDYRNFNEDLERALEYDRPAFVNDLFKTSELFRLIALGSDLFHFRTELVPEYRLQNNKEAIGENNVPAGLKRLKELSRAHDFQVLIALWPDFRDEGIFDNDLAPPELRDPADPRLTIERLAEEFQFPVLRLSPEFRADYAARRARGERRTPREVYTIGDSMHPVRTATAVGGRALAAFIDRHLDGRGGTSVPE